MSATAAADYLVFFRKGYYYTDAFLQRTQTFYMQESINVMKKTKRSEKMVDIRPLILEMHVEQDHNDIIPVPGMEAIFLKLVTGSEQNLKPHLVMEAFCHFLGYDYVPEAFMYHRLETYLKRDGRLMPLGAVGREVLTPIEAENRED